MQDICIKIEYIKYSAYPFQATKLLAFSLKITTNKKTFQYAKQVFYPDGTFKFKFGNKGTGNGEFDLPAGVAVDAQNRIVVVDKDNHRVQVFSCTGNFITKFGSYGKEIGQFMYPWAVASNYKTYFTDFIHN